MRMQTKTQDQVLIVAPQERRLDACVASAFKEAMDALIEQGHQRLVLDLSHVRFVDSSGLGAIVTTQRKLGRARHLVICGAADAVLRVFSLARLDKIFQIVDDVGGALALLAA